VRPERVYIILVNWNGWKNTLACLESVFRLVDVPFRVVVCDNASADDSLRHIREWAEGTRIVEAGAADPLSRLITPAIAKPIRYSLYEHPPTSRQAIGADSETSLVLIQTGANLGFAGGVNVGLRFALASEDFSHAWLLNNDTVVQPDTLRELVETLESDPRIGICGSTLVFYDQPDRVQALGGSFYSPWLARHRMHGAGLPYSTNAELPRAERPLDYVSGASMLVRRAFLQKVGLLDERYFLYMEELDWATRARGRYQLAHAPRSVVFHRDGGSTRAGGFRRRKNFKSDFYSFRSRLLYTSRYAPYALPVVGPLVALAFVERIVRRRWNLSDVGPTLAEFLKFRRRRANEDTSHG
jgi:GT2 family glycosyltransferase